MRSLLLLTLPGLTLEQKLWQIKSGKMKQMLRSSSSWILGMALNGFSSLPDVSVNLPCEHNWKHFHCCAGGGWLAPSHPSVLLPGQFGLLGNLLQLKYLTKDIAQLPGWRQKHFNAGVFYPILFLQLPGSCRVLPPGSNVVWLVPGSVQAPALSSPHRHQALLPAGHCILDEWLSL